MKKKINDKKKPGQMLGRIRKCNDVRTSQKNAQKVNELPSDETPVHAHRVKCRQGRLSFVGGQDRALETKSEDMG